MTPCPKPAVKTRVPKPLTRSRPKRTGMAKVRRSPYQHPEVQALFRQVRTRSSGWCEECQQRNATAVHHVRYQESGVRGWRRLVVPLSDLVHLCERCHTAKHPHLDPFHLESR